MKFKEYLISLVWNTFSYYPPQGSSIYLHCFTEDDLMHKFLKIDNFNAVMLDFDKIIKDFPKNKKWCFLWLPANEIDENYAKSDFNMCNADVGTSKARG